MLVTDVHHYYAATLTHLDSEDDIAFLSVAGYRPERRFVLIPDDMILQNETVLCLEYGTTRKQGGDIFLSVATRMGNITRQIGEMELLGRTRSNLLEVSFPALRGASGAPILTSRGFLVIGMLIANASYHLMPAQIEQVVGEEGRVIEEVQFMMPQGIALHASLLRQALTAAAQEGRGP
jgi:hypothetical protein